MKTIYDVPLIPQTSNMSCWAASMAMILSWKLKKKYQDIDLVKNGIRGLDYSNSYTNGLSRSDYFALEQNGFTIVEASQLTEENLTVMLMQHGPVWINTNVSGQGFASHAQVITGLDGHFVYINDPAPMNSGSQKYVSFQEVFQSVDELVYKDRVFAGNSSMVYLAHLSSFSGQMIFDTHS